MGFTGSSIAGATSSIAGFAKTIKPIVAVGSQIAGGIGQATGARQQYGGAADAALYNQAAFEQNAALIDAAAAQTRQVGEAKKRSYLSALKANVAARGLDLSGSPLLLMAESAAALELDIQNEEFNSKVDASRARSQASVYGIEAENYKKAGKKAVQNIGISTAYKIASEY